jgi:hypothetical protein
VQVLPLSMVMDIRWAAIPASILIGAPGLRAPGLRALVCAGLRPPTACRTESTRRRTAAVLSS